MTNADIVQARSDSGVFGEVIIERTESSVSTWLASDELRMFTIERHGPRTRKNVPIGTRDEKFLTATLADQPAQIHSGSGRLVRRSYRVTVALDAKMISFRPRNLVECRFIDGSPKEVEKQFGSLTAYTDGGVGIEWALPLHIALLKRTVIPPDPTPDDVLIGCGVATAFGTGSLSLTSIVMGLVASVFPS